MDLTALELGLRNRQILQVKCFLKIQVETFRYFLSEELPRLKNAEERISSLDKFFTHDWQNVINKIVSVAVVNMTGDYVSMMLAVSLFRSIIQSCNQLILIIASINDSSMDLLLTPLGDEPGRFLSRSSSSASSYDSQRLSDASTIKDKIFFILQKQIRSINSHLERIYNMNTNNDYDSTSDISFSYGHPKDASNLQISQHSKGESLTLLDVIHLAKENDMDAIEDIVLKKFGENLESTLDILMAEQTSDMLPLFQALLKKYANSQSNNESVPVKYFYWCNIIQKLIQIVSNQLKSNEVTADQIERINTTLSQTGISALCLLFTIFIKTCDAKLRQKLLQVFFTLFDDISKLTSAIQNELEPNNITSLDATLNNVITESEFSRYLKIMFFIDLYLFCYRPKLLETEHIEISIEWILNSEQSDFSLTKSIVLPSLEEIEEHPELFSNWKTLNEQMYNKTWPYICDHFVQKQDFTQMISAEALWQFWVDNNKMQSIQDWIANGTTSLPFCPNIAVPDDINLCKRMLLYLREKSSFYLYQSVVQSLCLHQTFFSGHSLNELDPDNFNFQAMLALVGRNVQLLNHEPPDLLACFFDKDYSQSQIYLQIVPLIHYCFDNELYEFLYLIVHNYRTKVEPIIQVALQSHTIDDSKRKSLMKFLLKFDSESLNEYDDEFIFSESLLVMKYLYGSDNSICDTATNDQDWIKQIAQLLIENQQDVELALLMLSLTKKTSFDQLAQYIKNALKSSQSDSKMSEIFLKLLNSKYSLIYKAFETSCIENSLQVPLLPSTSSENSEFDFSSEQNTTDTFINFSSAPATDLYSLLQQSIPYVSIDKFFKWQIKRRFQRLRLNSLPQESTSDSDDMQGRSRKVSTSLSCENNELPSFSQNRLSELYGLKAELTSSYYLKNGRLLEAFFKCFSLKSHSKIFRNRDHAINPKIATKAIRKAALIAYGSIKQNSIFSCCLLFQTLMRTCLSSSGKQESKKKTTLNMMDESVTSIHSIGSDVNHEIEKTRLHLSIGKLIVEYAPDLLSAQNGFPQFSVLASLLRKSHFNGDRASSQRLLDYAVIAIERKHTSAQAKSSQPNLNSRLHALLLGSLDENNHISGSSPVETQKSKFLLEDCHLLMECFEWKPLLMFADLLSLKRPFNFLIKSAQEDNWLIFSIFAQMYTISKDDIQALLRNNIFNNHCIGEHLAKAFQSSSRLTGATLSETESKLVKLKQAPTSSRNDFYSKLFKGKVASAHSELDEHRQIIPEPPESEFLSISSSPETFSLSTMSVMSKLNDESGTIPLVLYENLLKPETASKDFLQLVLDIYQSCAYFGTHTILSANYSMENTFRNTLLFASVSLSNPILALLACSLDRLPLTPVMEIKSPSDSTHSRSEWSDRLPNSNTANSQFKFNSFMCWLLSSVDFKLKQLFLDSYLYSHGQTSKKPDLAQCYLSWTVDRSLHLIDVLTQQNASVFVTLLEGFRIFDLDIPILQKLLSFFSNFFIEKDYYQADTVLLEFKALMQSYNEDEFLLSKGVPPSDYEHFEIEEDDFLLNQGSLRIFYSKNWIEKCSLILVTNSLLLSQQFELNILLSHYNFVRLQESFSPNCPRIPDIRNLYLFSVCLAKLPNFVLPIAELLRHGPPLSDNGTSDYTEYVSIFRKLIFDLQEAGNFEEARNIINLLPKANANEFIINEWMLKAKKMNNSAEMNFSTQEDVILDKIDLPFWENCWAQVTKLDPSMHSAFKVMERFVQHLQPNQVLIKCFVLLKCMLAIESILRDFIETNESDSRDKNEESLFDDLSTNNLELVQDYFQFEHSLWSSAVECEFLILNKKYSSAKMDDTFASGSSLDLSPIAYGDEDNIVNAWKLIWRDIIIYIKSSSFSSTIIPKLSLRHTFLYKNISSKRHKNETSLDSEKQSALKQVIGQLLDSLCLQKAKEVSAMFHFTHDDFEIIQACDNAAQGKLQNVTDASFAVQFKIQNADLLQPQNSYSLFSCLSLTTEQKRIISLIQEFSNFATIGKKSCDLILLYYKISCLLTIPYSDLMNANYTSLKVFQLLLSSYQSDSADWRFSTNSNDTSDLTNSIDIQSRHESLSEDTDQSDHNRTLTDTPSTQTSLINQYMEAITCAKDLIKIVNNQDQELNSESKIATHLANYTLNEVQQLVDLQFKDASISSMTEIELDKHQLAFYSARFLVLIKLLQEPSILGHALIDICKKQRTNLDNIERLSHSNAKEGSIFLPMQTNVATQSAMEYAIIKRKHYVLMVELYIRAHECFTAQCDVHGIALVLRRTRLFITQELQTARYFHLILRLLTGIGRYSEMTYCFDLFGECDRFELILSKRVQRTPQLRIALLNYLKTSANVDELLPLVAIRFFLFRETADYHRARAERILAEICSSQGGNTSAITQSHSYARLNSPASSLSAPKRISSSSLSEHASHSPTSVSLASISTNLIAMHDQLETVMYEFQEAESNYTKASSHTNADYCSCKAQLVALQIAFINRVLVSSDATTPNVSQAQPSIPLIISMDASQVREYTYQCNHFYEALIVSRAYDVNIDWTDPILHNVILNGNLTYLAHYTEIFPISTTLLKDLLKRYDQLCNAFKQQSRSVSNNLYSLNQPQSANSPSSSSFMNLLSNVRSENELLKGRRALEQLLEQALCPASDSQSSKFVPFDMTNCSIKDKYKLINQFDSPRLMQRLMEADAENSAYLLDLKHTKKI